MSIAIRNVDGTIVRGCLARLANALWLLIACSVRIDAGFTCNGDNHMCSARLFDQSVFVQLGIGIMQQLAVDEPHNLGRNGTAVNTTKNLFRLAVANDDKCLEVSDAMGDVTTWFCYPGPNQEWYFDGLMLKSNNGDRCLEHSASSGIIVVVACTSGTNQQWNRVGLTIKATPSGCLHYHSSGSVDVQPCRSQSVAQEWHFKGLATTTAPAATTTASPLASTALLATTSLLATTTTSTSTSLTIMSMMASTTSSTSFAVMSKTTVFEKRSAPWTQPGEVALATGIDDRCLEYNGNSDGEVNVQTCSPGPSQWWYLDGLQLKTSGDKCLEYSEDTCKVKVSTCTLGTSQEWYFVGLQMKTSSGFCLNYNGHGLVELVKCYTQSDATQQWHFKGAHTTMAPLEGASFSIRRRLPASLGGPTDTI